MNKVVYPLLAMLLLPATAGAQDTTAQDAGQKVDVAAMIKECEGCHGINGHSTRDDVPSLAGRPVMEIVESVAQFYYYERHCPAKRPVTPEGEGGYTNMCSIANTLNKDEVMQLAEFFAAQ